MAKDDLNVLMPKKRTVKIKDKEYQISELTNEVAFSFIKFLGQIDYVTQGKIKEFIKVLIESGEKKDTLDIDEYIKIFINNFLELIFAFVNEHTRGYFYEFLSTALSDEDKNIEFTIKDAKKLKLKESMKIVRIFLSDEDVVEMLRDGFFPIEGAKKKAGR